MTTTESNKLIAEFMGLEKTEREGKSPVFKHALKKGFVKMEKSVGNLEYHTSWDWLMPVVEKIEAIKGVHIVIKTSVFCEIYKAGSTKAKGAGASKIESVYSAVVEFIKWHNQSKQQLNN